MSRVVALSVFWTVTFAGFASSCFLIGTGLIVPYSSDFRGVDKYSYAEGPVWIGLGFALVFYVLALLGCLAYNIFVEDLIPHRWLTAFFLATLLIGVAGGAWIQVLESGET